VNNLRAYRGVSALKKAVMNILVKMTSSKEIEDLRELFTNIDKDGTGYITAIELKEALKEANISYSEQEIESIINEVDYKGKKKINYTEFLAASVSVKKILTEERLRAIFK
jgi:Ca2+-binding EF-hand superfamily protein